MKPPSGFSPSTHQGNANTNLKSSFDERYVLGNLENFIKMLPIIKGNFSLIFIKHHCPSNRIHFKLVVGISPPFVSFSDFKALKVLAKNRSKRMKNL